MPLIEVSNWVKEHLDRLKESRGHKSYDSAIRELIHFKQWEKFSYEILSIALKHADRLAENDELLARQLISLGFELVDVRKMKPEKVVRKGHE